MPVRVTMPDGEIAMLARELGQRLGVSEIEAVRQALRRALEGERGKREPSASGADIAFLTAAAPTAPTASDARERAARRRRMMDAITRITAAMPVLDDRPESEILGYDDMMR